MTKRTFFGIILIVAGLLKLADMWDILHWEWLWSQPWTEYIAPALLIYLGGDVITAIDGIAVNSLAGYYAALDSKKPGDVVSVAVLRGRKTEVIEIVLTE